MSVLDVSQILGGFGEFFGAIAVVATLVYLSVQVRQNSKLIKHQTHLSSSEPDDEVYDARGRIASAFRGLH